MKNQFAKKGKKKTFPSDFPPFSSESNESRLSVEGGEGRRRRRPPPSLPLSSFLFLLRLSVRPFLGPSPHPSLAFRPSPPPPPPPHISNPLPLLRLFPLFLSRLRLVPSPLSPPGERDRPTGFAMLFGGGEGRERRKERKRSRKGGGRL